jgi:hypothetical protein
VVPVNAQMYWILFTYYYCPVCGSCDTVRERVYDIPKPKDRRRRHVTVESYDYCDSL